ncbi:MAG: ATP-binding cassette domain-containing protein [Marinibacterium sp.]|nr:ATP-binding cassette domain-containing protein [Marinibacterium sp.]
MATLFPLTVTDAETRRRGKVLVGPVSMTLQPGGTTVVIGPNGSGKTSLLRLLNGAARISAGQIRWACSQAEARAEQAFVFQKPVMLRRSVLANLVYPLRMRGVSRRDADERARDWAERVGLTDMLARPAPVLSGGEQQKLALARALITDPALVFLDEPCSALDGRATREIEAILTQARAAGTRLILTTHDMGQARRLGDDILFLHRGQIREQGPADRFFDHPQTPQAQAFLRGDILE